jgi:hypothetical protein
LKSGKTYESPGIRYLLLALDTIWLGAIAVHATDDASPIGLWKGQDATFEMFESEGKLSAQIVALSEPNTSEGKEKTDVHNPDPTKRNHPIIGLVFICGFGRKVTLAGRMARFMTRRVAKPIPV